MLLKKHRMEEGEANRQQTIRSGDSDSAIEAF